jgi:hypothetical protein
MAFFKQNTNRTFVFFKLWSSLSGVYLLHVVGGNKGVPDIPAQNKQIVSVGSKIKESHTSTFNDRGPWVDAHWINRVAASDKLSLAPPILFTSKIIVSFLNWKSELGLWSRG